MPGRGVIAILLSGGTCPLLEEAGQEYPYRTAGNSMRKDHLRMTCGSVSEMADTGRECSCFRAPCILPSVQLCRSGDQKSKCALLNLCSGSFEPVTNMALGFSQILGLFVGVLFLEGEKSKHSFWKQRKSSISFWK